MPLKTETRKRRPACPSSLKLEAHLMGLADLRSHLASCPSCSARLAGMVEDGEYFRQVVYPATSRKVIGSVDEAAARRSADDDRFPDSRRRTG